MQKAILVSAGVGGVLLSLKLLRVASFLWRNFLRPGNNLARRYGKGSWVVITGACGGIGLAFAQAFAALKFNLVLIDKNSDAIRLSNELSEEYRIETLPILIDFAETPGNEDFFLQIATKTRDLDVSVLVNNVGEYHAGPFSSTDRETIEKVVTVNIGVVTKLTRMLLQKLMRRPKKAAIINMSSVVGLVPGPYSAVYSATKAYVRMFSLALAHEVQPKVDVLVGTPAVVRTGMSSWLQHGYWSVSPDLFVRRLLASLGHDYETIGAKRHQIRILSCRSFESQVALKGESTLQLLSTR